MPATGSVADAYLQQILGTLSSKLLILHPDSLLVSCWTIIFNDEGGNVGDEDASNTAFRWNVVLVSVASSLALVAISAAILVILLKRPDVRAFLSRYKPLRDSGEVEQINLNT